MGQKNRAPQMTIRARKIPMDQKNRALLMIVLALIPNIFGLAASLLELAGSAEQLAQKLTKIGKILCLPFSVASACIAALDSKQENPEHRIIALWMAFNNVLTFLVFPKSEEE